jgi:antitoxin (DNA-binding transcriptional repressor) of toxin-antitoxin stability system
VSVVPDCISEDPFWLGGTVVRCDALSRLLFDKVASGSYLDGMLSVGLKTLKNKLSEYVRLAAGGETVLITDRERVVAELVPPRETRATSLTDSVLADAVREGLITPALLGPGPPPESVPVGPLSDLLQELEEDRSDR